jgi:uncharacterized phage protein (TIGR01671 family)
MREIKFRIWYYDQKKFDNNVELKDFKRYSFPLHWCCVQQYTGLKDKNGNLIYEGDIVKYARTKVESIEFAKNCFKNNLIELGEEIGEILFIKPSFCLSFDHIRYDDVMPMCLAEHRYEVIGNIFENPELIKNNE